MNNSQPIPRNDYSMNTSWLSSWSRVQFESIIEHSVFNYFHQFSIFTEEHLKTNLGLLTQILGGFDNFSPVNTKIKFQILGSKNYHRNKDIKARHVGVR